ncbi:DNA methylase [Candidatus Burarchaeum australiense]|nr:DNA methylase [Candidatus Burarchaeum australiense]
MKIDKESIDLIEERKKALKQLIPDIFTEGKIDFNKLREALGDFVETSGERYSFSWAGRIQSIRTRDKRSKATLVPSRKESVNFDETKNVFIEGENLEVLKILQKAYEGNVKMIYIDPPYNTGKDFVYRDDFTDSLRSYLRYTGQSNGNGEKATTNPETSGRYHSNWLSMMYPRLFLARNLLSEDGVIFVSIDDNEVHDLRLIMNEIFGEENFIAQIVWKKRSGGANDTGYIVIDHEYVLVYAKDKQSADIQDIEYNEDNLKLYSNKDKYVQERGPYRRMLLAQTSLRYSEKLRFSITAPDGSQITLPNDGKSTWRWGRNKVKWGVEQEYIEFVNSNGEWKVYTKQYLNVDPDGKKIERGARPRTIYSDVDGRQGVIRLQEIFDRRLLEYPKPVELIKHLIKFSTDKDSLVLDFFAGSGTTAEAIFEYNVEASSHRKFILVQLPEPTPEDSEARKADYKTIADIGKERLRRVIKQIKEEQKQKKLEGKENLDLGFKVLKLSKSNCFVWDSEEAKDPNTLVKHIEESAKGASKAEAEALIFELMLREGFKLDSEIQKIKQGKNEFYKISDGEHALWMCFDDKIDDEAVKKLGLAKDDKLVVLDSSLTDTQKVNLARKLRVETV